MFGDILKKLRNEKRLSQQELAEIVGKSQQAVYFWEKGDNEPGIETLKKLANFFNVTTDYLLGRPEIEIQIAEDHGINTISDVERILDDAKKALQKAVADGKITQDTANEAAELALRQMMLVLNQKQ